MILYSDVIVYVLKSNFVVLSLGVHSDEMC